MGTHYPRAKDGGHGQPSGSIALDLGRAGTGTSGNPSLAQGVFSEIRLLQKFKPGQIWALYSDIDKYPNCYAFIEKVELQNNEVQARWLEVCPDGELEKISIEDRTVGCGTYKVGNTDGIMIYTDMKSFSHRVNAIFTGRRNSYEIYPRKDEVWALLKGWDIGWSSDAHNQKKYKYEVVQVLSDFTTGTSITVMPLVKIKVFVSLFMQSKEATPYLIRQDDTIWFSHCIPYRLMGAAESEGIPEGALELDPAALPLNLEQPHVRVVSESRSVKGSEFDAAYAGSSRGNKSHKESEGVGERQHATCMNRGIFAKTSVVENRDHNTPSTVEGMDVAEESDHAQAKVLCPEFFDFDQLRDVSRFRRNQIWAVYDTKCCIPRFYARITKVRRAPKFEVHFVSLEFDPRNKAEVAWSRGELPVACGHFKHGASHTAKETKIFSQIISYEKIRTRNSFEIYPKKGEVWALFKGWDIGWSSDAKNHTDFMYEVVQVLSDFTTSTSIIAMPLVKGTERDGIPEGAVELDPDALPPNLEDAFASVVPESSYTQSAVQDSTDVYEESDDIIQAEFECAESEFHEFTEMRSLDKFKPGQIWALYNDMDKFPNYYAGIRKVDLKNNKVQILTHTDSSIQVKLLRKVDGHRTVFRREPSVETICKEEYLKFSHQIPRFHLTNEKGGKLRGCLELDPFSVPERFLGIDSMVFKKAWGTAFMKFSNSVESGQSLVTREYDKPGEEKYYVSIQGIFFTLSFCLAEKIRNSMFAFCSLGVKIDDNINTRLGPYVFKICQLAYDWGWFFWFQPGMAVFGGRCLSIKERLNPKPLRKGLASATLLTGWMIWKQRNACVFEGDQPSVHQPTEHIKAEAALWARTGASSLRLVIPSTWDVH
uniref:DUF3444 domain-containing protein n=1 Tax=Aegilops tauschii TaxID=37682 RepID=N1R1C2_AEGTA